MKLFLVVIFILTALAVPASAVTPFTATRHVNTTFTNADMDTALNDVNRRLSIDNDRCNDVPCTATFIRSGNVGTFGTAADGLDTVDTQEELDSVFSINTHIAKIVTSLSRCAGTNNPSFMGCGLCGASGYVVESWVSGDAYIHEYGHNIAIHDCYVNMGHRNDCPWNIMNSGSDGTNDAVDASECSSFGGKAYAQLCGDVYGTLDIISGPYWVTCTVTVPAGQTLTVQPGVEIQFKHGNKVTVNGALNADGTIGRILLYSNASGNPSMKIEKQIKLMSGGQLLLH